MENPDLYRESNGLQSSGVRFILEEYKEKLNWGCEERVLDIGCGPGDTTCNTLEKILPKDAILVGCDISSQMVSHATKVYGNERRSFRTVDISQADIWGNMERGYFDKVFSFYCLHWVQDQKQSVRNICSLLKENGVGLVCIPVTHECFTFYDTFSKMPEWAPYMKDRYGISPYYSSKDPIQDYLDILSTVPLKVISCEIKHLVYRYSSLKSLCDMLEAVNPYVPKMPRDVKEKFLEELRKYFKETSKYEPDGKIRSDYSVIVAIFQKSSQN